MKKYGLGILVGFVLILLSCNNQNKNEGKNEAVNETKTVTEPTNDELIQRGEYLVTTMGCNDCHSPKTMGPQGPQIISETMLSGYPENRPVKKVDKNALKDGLVILNEDFTSASGMWGTSFAANLTPDQTGIGNWTEENFKRALKEGKFKGLPNSRTLLPPMPWPNFANLSDEDAHAMFTYLQSLPPVKNAVPAAIPFEELK